MILSVTERSRNREETGIIHRILENGVIAGRITEEDKAKYYHFSEEADKELNVGRQQDAYQLLLKAREILEKADPGNHELLDFQERCRRIRREQGDITRKKVDDFVSGGCDRDTAWVRVWLQEERENLRICRELSLVEEEADDWDTDFLPEYVEIYDPDIGYCISPAQVALKPRINIEDVKEVHKPAITVEEEYFDSFLVDYFMESLRSDWAINRNRYSREYDPDGKFIDGFEIYTHYNFYGHEDIRQVVGRLKEDAQKLQEHRLDLLKERNRDRMLIYCIHHFGVDEIPHGVMKRAADFYERIAGSLENGILKGTNESVIAVSLM